MNQYEIAAEMTGIEWCRSSADCGVVLYHHGGHAAVVSVDNRLHFDASRRQTKRGLYEFLKGAYYARYPDLDLPSWLRLYHRARWQQQMALDMQRRLPRAYFEEARARVREAIAKGVEFPEGEEEEIRRWARR